MFARRPIRHKLLVGLILVLVTVATLAYSGVHGLYAYRSLVKSLGWRVHEFPLGAELSQRVGDLRVNLFETSHLRSFPIDSAEQQPLTAQLAREEFRAHLAGIEDLLARYLEQIEYSELNSGRIAGDIRRQRETIAELRQALMHIRDIDQDENWIFDDGRVGRLHDELESLHQLAARLPQDMYENFQQFSDQTRGQYRALIVLAWMTSAIAALLFAMAVWLFYRWIFHPLNVLIQGSRRVASGDFDHRILLETHDEMSELASAMNGMTTRFQDICTDLDQQVRQRTQEVVRNEQLASVGFLAAGVSHEINNPLASIAMCAESLEGRVGPLLKDDDEQHQVARRYLSVIQEEAFRCKEITEKLLDFSRMGETRRQPTDLHALVESVIDVLTHVDKYKHADVRFHSDTSVTAVVNAQEMKQVMLNLITNSIDSLDDDGQVNITLATEGEAAVIEVADNGCGMDAETLKHVFEPFFTRRRTGQGTGLGLSITYRIVADHDGQIIADSAGRGHGSTFRVRIPLAANHQESRHQYQAA